MNKKKSVKSAGKSAPVKRGRGRPPGSKNKPKEATLNAPARKKAPVPAKKAAKKVVVPAPAKKAVTKIKEIVKRLRKRRENLETAAPAAPAKRGRGRPPGARNKFKQAEVKKEPAAPARKKATPVIPEPVPADPPDMIIARIKDEKTFSSMSGEVPDVKTLVSAAVFNREIRSGATHYIVTTDMSSNTPNYEMLVYDNEVMEVDRDGERISRVKSDKAKIGDRIIIGKQPYKVLQDPEKWVQTMGWIGVQ